jgi:hypothetical protein
MQLLKERVAAYKAMSTEEQNEIKDANKWVHQGVNLKVRGNARQALSGMSHAVVLLHSQYA